MRKPASLDLQKDLERIAIPQGGEVVYCIAGGNRELLGVILHGEGAPSFSDTTVEYALASGDRVTAACHPALGHYGVNQDRLVINIHGSRVAGMDGYGPGGDRYVQLLGDRLLFDDTQAAIAETVAATRSMMLGNSGACLGVAPIVTGTGGRKTLDAPELAGDVRITVLDEKGGVVWESTDQDMATTLVRIGQATPDEALYAVDRGTVMNSVTSFGSYTGLQKTPAIPLKSGFRILVESDGRTDNVMTEEIPKAILTGPARGLVDWLGQTVLTRMANNSAIRSSTTDRKKSKRYSDGFRTKPKPDNLLVAVVDVA